MSFASRALILTLATLTAAVWAAPAFASVISVTGPNNTGRLIDDGEAVAISFVLDRSYTNVSVDASILCINCTGSVWLHRNRIEPEASFNDSLGAFALSGTPDGPLFENLTLEAGTYFLIVAADTGGIGWSASSAPVIDTDSGARIGLEFLALNADAYAPRSDFRAVFEEGSLLFEVSGTAVPVPPAVALFLTGLAILRARSRS